MTLLITFQWCLIPFSVLEDEDNYPLMADPQRTFKMKEKACKKAPQILVQQQSAANFCKVLHLQNEDRKYSAVTLKRSDP